MNGYRGFLGYFKTGMVEQLRRGGVGYTGKIDQKRSCNKNIDKNMDQCVYFSLDSLYNVESKHVSSINSSAEVARLFRQEHLSLLWQ